MKNNITNLLKKNAPDLLLVGGVVSILGAGVLAIKETPRAVQILDQEKETENIYKIKKVAPLYIPSVVLTVLGITQIVWSRNITNGKIAALATAYTVSETGYRTYREKIKELVEPETYEKIRKEVAHEVLQKDPVGNKEVIITTHNDVLMYDKMSGRYFMSNRDYIEKSVNELNRRMISENYLTLNELYYEIGLAPIKMGDMIGWDISNGMIEIDYDSDIADDGRPCIVLDYYAEHIL